MTFFGTLRYRAVSSWNLFRLWVGYTLMLVPLLLSLLITLVMILIVMASKSLTDALIIGLETEYKYEED